MSKSKSRSGGHRGSGDDKVARDNYSRQLNPQHDTYWRARGYQGRPEPFPDGTSKKSR